MSVDEVPEGCPLHPHLEAAAIATWRQRNRALVGFLVASVIFTALMYATLFDARAANVESCEGRNQTRGELNERGKTTKTIIDVLIDARKGRGQIAREGGYNRQNAAEIARLAVDRRRIDLIPLLDCEAEYPRPWPFG